MRRRPELEVRHGEGCADPSLSTSFVLNTHLYSNLKPLKNKPPSKKTKKKSASLFRNVSLNVHFVKSEEKEENSNSISLNSYKNIHEVHRMLKWIPVREICPETDDHFQTFKPHAQVRSVSCDSGLSWYRSTSEFLCAGYLC